MMTTDKYDEQARALMLAQPPFADYLGLRLLRLTPTCVEAELQAREELTNVNGGLHGGAIMALADHLGGIATILNLPPEKTTTTLESKTNFFRPIPRGVTARGVCVPLHRGRSTMVWQTTISLEGAERVAAIVTQTQMVLSR